MEQTNKRRRESRDAVFILRPDPLSRIAQVVSKPVNLASHHLGQSWT
jgi:hypothetical protein